MKELVLLGYEGAAALLPFLAVLALWAARENRRGRPLSRFAVCAAAVLAVYAAGVYHCTGAGTLYDLLTYGVRLQGSQINLAPFSRHIDVAAYALNVVLLAPFGFLAPLCCQSMRGWRQVAVGGFGLSLLIELSQLLNNRSTDVDDLILNTLGALAGWGLWRLWQRRGSASRQEMPFALFRASLLIPFAGRFLLFHEIGLARLLYGF